MRIEKATLKDVEAIHDLVLGHARKGLMLYRPRDEIEYHIRDYFVCRRGGRVVGCAGLRVWNRGASEIYALAVEQNHAGKGIGKSLVRACVNEARRLGVRKVFALTFRKEMFLKLGFKKVTLREIPRIMFTEKTVDVDKAYGMRL